MKYPPGTGYSAILQGQALANTFKDYLRLTREEHMTTSGAAKLLGRPASLFSGFNSMLERYLRGGLAAIVPDHRGVAANHSDLTKRIEALGWFIPAARFFYLNTNLTTTRGSVPEAIRRTISLPALPIGWRHDTRSRFLKALTLSLSRSVTEPPICPKALRDEMVSRERAGRPMIPSRVARQITTSAAVVRQRRNPVSTALDYFNAAGSLFFFTDPLTGVRRPPKPGEVIEADDSTINFPVCVPWDLGGDPCSDRYGVKAGRFQWLVSIDAARRFVTAWIYVMRPRCSYRGEDALALMRTHCLQHGVPLVWRFEQGRWKSNLVKLAIEAMGSHLHTVWSPHQKPFIEGLFNTLWTKLSVHFPGCDVGRFRGENEQACRLLTACQQGHQDPRRHFPMLKTAVAAFDECIAEKNDTPVNSDIGRWVPSEAWDAAMKQGSAIRRLEPGSEWIFSPCVREWKVSGAQVGGRIPLFENLSVPFDFVAPWLVHYKGARVRCHFDSAAPDCQATVILLENWNNRKAGEVLGTAQQINSVASYARLSLGWANDHKDAGRLARQQSAAALRRELRAVIPGRRGYRASEERDGISQIVKLESDGVMSRARA